MAAANAALANATLAHGLDFDDTREDAIVHTGSVAVTTSLAVGEAAGASGRAALEAIVASVEVMCRVGLAVPGKFHARHYHPTALTGTFGSIRPSTTPRQFVGHVRVRLRDGRVVEEWQDHPRGGPDSPMRRDEVESKFRGNASLVMSADQASRVIRRVEVLAREPNLHGLVESLKL